jgi:hypothetical protein
MRTTLLLLTIALTSAACGSKNKGTCDAYADMSMKCDKDTSMKDDEKAQAKTMLSGMCVAAFDGEYAGASGDEKKMMEEMYAHIKETATCGSKAKTCEEYAKCEEAAKKK